jgi:hypothetical protein
MFQNAPNHVHAQAANNQWNEFEKHPTDYGYNRQASHRDQKRLKLLSESEIREVGNGRNAQHNARSGILRIPTVEPEIDAKPREQGHITKEFTGIVMRYVNEKVNHNRNGCALNQHFSDSLTKVFWLPSGTKF